MSVRWIKAIALLLPLALTSCLLQPGKFVSTLRIDADRHFVFSYTGEVYATDFDKIGEEFDHMEAKPAAKSKPADKSSDSADAMDKAPPVEKATDATRQAQTDTKNRAIAQALSMEKGYRKVVYQGNGKFLIDYALSGTLDRGFVWPYNFDAEVLLPFIVIEARANDTVRVKAPGYANGSDATKSMGGLGGGAVPRSQLDGTFTLDTDAEIVSQNNEDGTAAGAAGRKAIVWKATPTTKDAPSAVLRFR